MDDKRQKEYLAGKLRSKVPDTFDRSFYDQDTMKVTSPSTIEAKIEAFRAMRDADRGISVPESTYDAGGIRDQMVKARQPGVSNFSKLKNVMKGASKGLKAVPLLGSALGVASALSSNDASAAVPMLDQEALGYDTGSLEQKVETQGMGSLTPEEHQQLMKRMREE